MAPGTDPVRLEPCVRLSGVGTPMGLEGVARERGIRYFLVSFTDLLGMQRAKLVPAAAIDACCARGAPFAGSATWLNLSAADSELLALPDAKGLIQLPWKPDVGWLPSDLFLDGKPLAQGPRNALGRLVGDAAREGFRLTSEVVPEFYLVAPCGTRPAGSSGERKERAPDAYTPSSHAIVAEIREAMAALGWVPKDAACEGADGRFELGWACADALVTADRHAFYTFMVRAIAEKHGLRATFMPKPFPPFPKSVCRTRVSLWRDGVNVFLGLLPETTSNIRDGFFGDLIEAAVTLKALTEPTVDPYEAVTENWTAEEKDIAGATSNRFGDLETRDVNPYLLHVDMVILGLKGIIGLRSIKN